MVPCLAQFWGMLLAALAYTSPNDFKWKYDNSYKISAPPQLTGI